MKGEKIAARRNLTALRYEEPPLDYPSVGDRARLGWASFWLNWICQSVPVLLIRAN